MARPRSITDQDIIAEAYDLIMELGPTKLTFEKLGARVGLVPAALVRRFKTKQQLIVEIDRYALARTDTKVQTAMDEASSPINAILAQFTTELSFASSIERFANGLEFLLMDFRDKDLYTNYQVSFKHRHEQIIELLQKAQESGELEAIDDIEGLARHLEMILHGSGHVWAMTQEGPIEDYISQHINIALKPYKKQ
ncbi:MAG TPA: TetR family transcriptional regulator [Candidatus Saccharimonadales bacterium]|nr:TetR family transcriptional regulator [Candidatus Saccharimonadales bacterium]